MVTTIRGHSVAQVVIDAAMLGALVIAIGAVGLVLRNRFTPSRNSPPSAPPDTTSFVVADWPKLVSEGRRIGSDSASVVIVEFGDFQCPACGLFEHQLRELRERHPGTVAVVFRHFPLPYHEYALPAARAAECAASQGRFAAFHDDMYDLQDSLGLIPFEEVALKAGVSNREGFVKCLRGTGKLEQVERDIAAVKALRPFGTPTLAISGIRLGFVPQGTQLESLFQAANDDAIRGNLLGLDEVAQIVASHRRVRPSSANRRGKDGAVSVK